MNASATLRLAVVTLLAVFAVACAGTQEPRCISYGPAGAEPTGIHNAVPIFRSSDLEKSLDYHVNVLGFKRDWYYKTDPNSAVMYASVSRGGASVHLSKNIHEKVIAYFYVSGVDDLHDEWKAARAEIMYDPHAKKKGPVDQPWGVREIYLTDPDGNILKFGELLEE